MASQAMMARFCAQMRTMSVLGRFGWSGSTTNTPATTETTMPDRERGDDVADPPAHPAAGAGDRRR